MGQSIGAKRRSLPEYLTHDEVLAMLRAAGDPVRRLLMLTMWRAGLRVSEALALTRADLRMQDPGPALIVREGKGRKPRTVPMHPELVQALSTALGYIPPGDGPIIRADLSSAWRWVRQVFDKASPPVNSNLAIG